MSGIEFKNGCIVYYGNPAGYLKEDKATVDKIGILKHYGKMVYLNDCQKESN